MMNQFCLFSSGLELSHFVVSSDLLHRCCDAISDLYNLNRSNDPISALSVKHKVFEYPPNVTVMAFVSSPEFTVQHFLSQGAEMVSSEELRGSFELFDFVKTKVNPSFSIHKAAVSLFSSAQGQLFSLKQQFGNSSPLMITGHGLGGSIASLFTLWLLDSISLKDTKPPICITFGSPFLGDRAFQRAVSERPTWNSCFLHVVSNQDPIPPLFISHHNSLSDPSTSQSCIYKPFGTFLVCSDTGCACFDLPESVSELLKAMGSNCVENRDPRKSSKILDYRRILNCLKYKIICKETSLLGDYVINGHTFRKKSVVDPLQAEVILQVEAVGIRSHQQQESGGMSSLITDIKKRVESHLKRRRTIFDPTKKLNDMKIHMTYLEWYKKITADQGGYYDSYRNTTSRTKEEIRSREEIVKRKIILTQYWKKMVAEIEKKPQKENAAFRTRWLFAGTNYRRMIEPLDIAEYYSKGQRNYVTEGRSEHYILLEQWLNEDISTAVAKERNKACSLTEDSCFWAHLEEAIMYCRMLKNGQNNQESEELLRGHLSGFEKYAMDQINKYAVSSEIFIAGSSFMRWWGEYYELMGASYDSPLLDFMNSHHHEYA